MTYRRRLFTLASMALAVCGVSAMASAQVVRGTVVDATDHPVSGVVVVLLDSAQTAVARALTNDRGEYRVAAPHAGTYRLRTLRIGFQPSVTAPKVLADGTVSSERLVLDGVRVALEAIRVVERSACGRQSTAESGAILSAWDQAMTSIAATSLTSSGRGLTATTMQIERTMEPDGRKIRSQGARVRTDYVTQPWKSLHPDTLRRRGYTQTDAADWTTFYAPGLDVLVSSPFLEDHCVRLVAAADTTEIGVSFEPTPERRALSEIRGTVWLARGTAELRRLDFSFTAGATAIRDFAAGGSMGFTRLPDGSIVISSWEIRMPQLVKDSPRATRVRVSAVNATGGELIVLRRGADTLFKRPALSVAGVVLDSTTGDAIARATVALVGTDVHTVTADNGSFTLADVLPGEYAIAVRTPSLDSIRASSQSTVMVADGMARLKLRVPTARQLSASLCGSVLDGIAGRGKGAILGTVREARDTSTLTGVRVAADWTEFSNAGATSASLQSQGRRLETKTDSSGAFRLCGVPTELPLTIRALPLRGRAQSATVRLSSEQRFATTALIVEQDRAAVAAFVGVVVADSSGRPLADAEIAVPALALTTRSNARGEFRLADIPAGTQSIVVRRVGYGVLATSLTFAANDEEDRRIILRPATILDSVAVISSRLDVRLRDFEENRRVGLGSFLDRAELDRHIGRKMGDVLSMLPGAGVVRGRSGAWPMSKRYVVPIAASIGQESASIYKPSELERIRGLVAGCYAQVYVDGQIMNQGRPTEPYDINSLAPDQIEAMEWYASPSQTPSRYAKLDSPCGVLVIHTRRRD